MSALRRLVLACAPAVGLAVAYVVVGLASLQLAIPPGYASPIYPSAGIALAVTLVYGWRALPGAFLGGLAVNLSLSASRGTIALEAIAVPLAVGVGAALQAGWGAWLLRGFRARLLRLDEPRDILRFFVLGGPISCLVNASIATVVLSQLGVVAPSEQLYTAWTWWIGDTMGVLIAAPITLTLIGRPPEDWRPRRATVGLPLVAVTLLLVLAINQVKQWDAQRAQAAFERTANATADAMAMQLREPIQALEALRGLYRGSADVSQAEMARATEVWLEPNTSLQALGYSPRVARSDIAAFEASARRDVSPEYKVFDRGDVPREIVERDTHVVAIRQIAPLTRNAAALGVNALSIPAARQAIERAALSNQPAATAGFRLTQDASGSHIGVVIYRALYADADTPPAERRPQDLTAVVFVTVRVNELAAQLMARSPSYLQWCLVDLVAGGVNQRLGGATGCERAPGAALRSSRIYEFGGRRWQLVLEAHGADLPFNQHMNAWLFSGVGLLAVSMLGALLLTVTGRARRIEHLVDARTADLRREISQRKHAQEALIEEMRARETTQVALQDSRQQLRGIVDHVPIGIRYTDLAGRIVEVNPAYCQLTGYRADELLGMDLAQLHHPDERKRAADNFELLVRGKVPDIVREMRYLTKDGRTRWVRVSLRLVGQPGDPSARTAGVVEDITEHLLLREAERARQNAETASQAKSEFLSRMSHELRTPLNAMLGFAQLLELDQQPSLTSRQKEWTGQIQHAGWHLLHMINDTMDLSRIEAGNLKLDTAAVDVAASVHTCLAMVEAQAEQRGLRVAVDLDPAAQRVLADPTRFKQILTNLLTNAVKYNVDGGSIHVVSRRIGHQISLVVADSGLGMSDSQLGQLFQPFNRLGRERSGTEGTGIGLVISRRLAELMGGTLVARSRAGEGSAFELDLPAPSEPVAPEALPAPGEEAHAADYHQRLVLYVEDNDTNVVVMSGILAQRPQVRLMVAGTGESGLASARLNRPSLVLLDMNLPDMTGLQLLRRMRDDPELGGVPIVMVSADATTQSIEQAFAFGANDYVTKPINVPGFLGVLDRTLEEQDTLFG